MLIQIPMDGAIIGRVRPLPAVLVLAAMSCAGCQSGPMGAAGSPSPLAWLVARPAATPAVVYEQTYGAPPAGMAPPAMPPASQPMSATGMPSLSGPLLEFPLNPPMVPPAEFVASPAAGGTATSPGDDLRSRVEDLETKLAAHETALSEARQDSAAARDAVADMQQQMHAWGRELSLVRGELQQRQAHDLQMLDEVNHALQQLLGGDQPPGSEADEHTARRESPTAWYTDAEIVPAGGRR